VTNLCRDIGDTSCLKTSVTLAGIGRCLARVTDRRLRGLRGRVALAKTIGDRLAPLMY
jgi:hypothetical protein